MPNQVSKEGLTDDQMNENCHLAITEVATSMKKKIIINPSYMYMLVNTFVHMTSEIVCLSVSAFKKKLKMFPSKKNFLKHVQV